MKTAIIGAGNMGGAIARGLAKGTIIPAGNIIVSNPTQGKLDKPIPISLSSYLPVSAIHPYTVQLL